MIFQMLIVQVVTFTVMILVLNKILRSSSFKETSRLQKLNEENAKKAQELDRKIIEAENQYRDKMAKAEDDVRELKTRAQKEIDELKDAALAKGKAESEQIISQALNTKQDMRAEVEEELQGKSVDLACAMVCKVLNADEQKAVYDGLVERFFRELSALDKKQLKTVDLDGAPEGRAEARTSHPMSEEQKKQLEEILSSKFDRPIHVQERLDKSIVSGICVGMGSFVIDGSLVERFRQAAGEIA